MRPPNTLIAAALRARRHMASQTNNPSLTTAALQSPLLDALAAASQYLRKTSAFDDLDQGSEGYLATAIRHAEGSSSMSQPTAREIGYRHFITYQRPYVIQVADHKHVFEDFFPRDFRNIKANIHFRTASGRPVAVGTHVTPAETKSPPHFNVNVYHADTVYYTMVFFDADKVRPAENARSEEILYLIENVPLGPKHPTTISDTSGRVVVPYMPPHPTRGSGRHRLVVLLLEQPQEFTESRAVARRDQGIWHNVICGNQVETAAKPQRLVPRGIFLTQSEWDESVSDTYKNHLPYHEPVFRSRAVGRERRSRRLRNIYAPAS